MDVIFSSSDSDNAKPMSEVKKRDFDRFVALRWRLGGHSVAVGWPNGHRRATIRSNWVKMLCFQ